jgi:hypothetical protein
VAGGWRREGRLLMNQKLSNSKVEVYRPTQCQLISNTTHFPTFPQLLHVPHRLNLTIEHSLEISINSKRRTPQKETKEEFPSQWKKDTK